MKKDNKKLDSIFNLPLSGLLAIFLTTFYITLRPLGVGLDVAEPETTFLACVSLLACLCALINNLNSSKFPIPSGKLFIAAFIFIITVVFSVYTASSRGYFQPALDLGGVWFSDLCIFIAILLTAREKQVRRLYICSLAAGLAVVAIYTLYQRFFAMDYFREILAHSELNSNASQTWKEGFQARLASDRASGPFAYANSLGGFILLLIPLFVGIAVNKTRKIFLVIIITSIMAFVFCGSKAGFLTGKLAECVAFYLLLAPRQRSVISFIKVSGYVFIASALTLSVAGGVAFLANKLFAEIALAVLWSIELFALYRYFSTKPLNTKIGLTGAVLAIFAIIIAIGTWKQYLPDYPGAKMLRHNIQVTYDVRSNYWKSAVDMIKTHPLSGFGLDNYGVFYSSFKQPGGWEVKRVHNHYLQLAVDGGIFLLLSFLLFWILFFSRLFSAKQKNHFQEQEKHSNISFKKFGIICGISVFFVTYLFFLSGSFNGLGIEFFFSEFWEGKSSIRGRGGSSLYLLLHGFINILLLPGCWLLVFKGCWQNTEKVVPDKNWLILGIGALLVHGFFDFHLYHAVISGMLWCFCALVLSYDSAGWKCYELSNISRKVFITIVIVICGIIFFGYSLPRFYGSVDRCIAEKLVMQKSPEAQEAALKIAEEALEYRPYDISMYNILSSLLIKEYIQNPYGKSENKRRKILDINNKILLINPYSSSIYAGIAQSYETLYRLQHQNKKISKKIEELYGEAVKLYPLKAQYRLRFSQALLRNHKIKEAKEQAKKALELSNETTDQRTKLNRQELDLANRIIYQP